MSVCVCICTECMSVSECVCVLNSRGECHLSKNDKLEIGKREYKKLLNSSVKPGIETRVIHSNCKRSSNKVFICLSKFVAHGCISACNRYKSLFYTSYKSVGKRTFHGLSSMLVSSSDVGKLLT